MARDDSPDAKLSLNGVYSAEFPVILGELTSYMAYFEDFVPRKIAMMGRGVKKYSIILTMFIHRL